jgi:hypothetical protein
VRGLFFASLSLPYYSRGPHLAPKSVSTEISTIITTALADAERDALLGESFVKTDAERPNDDIR